MGHLVTHLCYNKAAATACTVPLHGTEKRRFPMRFYRTCSVPGCLAVHYGLGYCRRHHDCFRRTGNPLAYQHPRFTQSRYREWWRYVAFSKTGCWIWKASKNPLGYGQLFDPTTRRLMSAYRRVYEFCIGPIPEGLEYDHLCRNPSCVNPDHLEPVTHAENMARAPWTAIQFRRAKTHCPHGHVYEGENVYVNPKGSRECRICRAERR